MWIQVKCEWWNVNVMNSVPALFSTEFWQVKKLKIIVYKILPMENAQWKNTCYTYAYAAVQQPSK